MRSAVVRVVVDAKGSLSPEEYESAVAELRSSGLEVIASPGGQLPDVQREVELIVTDDQVGSRSAEYTNLCTQLFGRPATLGVVTYISRGTDADAHGILSGFGVTGEVVRSLEGGNEVVTVTVTREILRKVPESRLHTALEAALNCEVRVVAG